MKLAMNQQLLPDSNVWIISSGRHVSLDLSKVCDGIKTTFVKEYRISDLARYLLDPNPIEVRKILLGCEVRYQSAFSDKVREKLRQVLPRKLHSLIKNKTNLSETLMTNHDKKVSALKDKGLESHVEKIRLALRTYDPILKRLSTLDRDKISTVTGICEDIGGNRSLLNLKGDIHEKIGYIANYLLKDVGVILEKARVSNGLFEMSGFDFSKYDAKNSHRLIKFLSDGKPRCCVVGSNGKVAYWVDDVELINQMHLLEHSIKANPKFSHSLSLCTKGDARPLRLLFKKHLEIDYTKSPLPALYKNLFDTYELATSKKDAVIKSLQNSQVGILFNYVPLSGTSEKRLFTNVSVMHEVSALDPIREELPELYSMINKMVVISEAGKYYLLDSIRGYNNE